MDEASRLAGHCCFEFCALSWSEGADVECLETCVTAERPKKYKKTTCGEYVAMKMPWSQRV